MRNSNHGASNQEMLEAFQQKLDELLEVKIDSSTNVLASINIHAADTENAEEDDYIKQLSAAVDKQLEDAEMCPAWNITAEDDGLHILIVADTGDMDETIVNYNDDLSYDIDEDTSNIMKILSGNVDDMNITREEFNQIKKKYNCSDDEAIEILLNNGHDADELGEALYS